MDLLGTGGLMFIIKSLSLLLSSTMLNSFICGSSGGGVHDDEEPPSEAAKRSKRRRTNNNKKNKKKGVNPYSSRGLDKFSSLLQHLEEKRQKVYKKLGSSSSSSGQQDMMVRFAYSNAKDWVPIVVKLGEKDQKCIQPNPNPNPIDVNHDKEIQHQDRGRKGGYKSHDESSNMNMKKMGRCSSYYYWLIMVVVLEILVCFIMCGRFFAISCTSVLWYVWPKIIKVEDLKLTKSMKKRKHQD